MGKCRHCKEWAGFFRSIHQKCAEEEKRRQVAIQGFLDILVVGMRENQSLDFIDNKINVLKKEIPISESETRALLVTGWEKSVDAFLDDNLLESKEEGKLVEFKEKFALSDEELNRNDRLMKTVKAATLRVLMDGEIPQRVKFDNALPFNLLKDERVVWLFGGTKYLEDKTTRQFVGGSSGISVRIAKGVYYRTSAFRGNAIEVVNRTIIDSGLLCATNLGIYFQGSSKSFRIPFKKIVSFSPFDNGVGITKDAANAKQQIFNTNDGWFTQNLLVNLSRIELNQPV